MACLPAPPGAVGARDRRYAFLRGSDPGAAGGISAPRAGGRGFGPGGPQPITVAEVAVKGCADLAVGHRQRRAAQSGAPVRARVDGLLLGVHFTEGQTVKAGQLLAEIDPAPFQAQLAQADGQLARDTAQLNNARLDLARYRDLWPRIPSPSSSSTPGGSRPAV